MIARFVQYLFCKSGCCYAKACERKATQVFGRQVIYALYGLVLRKAVDGLLRLQPYPGV